MSKQLKILVAGSLLLGGFLVCYGPPSQCEIHLLPAGFEGVVRIVYNDPAEPPLHRIEGCRLHQIPPSGVLRTSDDPNPGWGLKQLYFRWEADGELTKLPIMSPHEESGELGIRRRKAGSEWTSESPQERTVFTEYEVGRK
jgi:hypothetical protein